jgi:ATP phosphoribosyltransferase
MCQISQGGRFTEQSEDQTYKRLRDPEIVDGIVRQAADVGFLGSDKWEEWQPDLEVDWLGPVKYCDFVLAARRATAPIVRKRLTNGELVTAITSNPRWLGRLAASNGWNLSINYVSGSVEAFGEEADLVADLRVTGASLRDNGLEEFQVLESVKLGLIYRAESSRTPENTL